MSDLAAIAALTKRDLLRFSRDRSQILGTIGRPAIWMLLFGSGLRRSVGASLGPGIDYRQFTYAGAIAMTILFGGMFHGITIVWDREFGMLRSVLVAPISRASIVAGKTCAGAAVTLIQAVVAAAFAPFVGVALGPVSAVSLLVVMGVMSLAITGVGVAIGSRMRTFEGFGVVSNFVVLPLYFLSGGVFPPDGLPGWMRALVVANPVTYGVDWMRAVLGQPHVFNGGVDALATVAFAFAGGLAATLAFRRVAH